MSNDPSMVTVHDLIEIRTKALELAVQIYVSPEVVGFNIVRKAQRFEKYILEGVDDEAESGVERR